MSYQPQRGLIAVLAGVTLCAGCGRGAGGASAKLQPPEAFHWIWQPISFSPPPANWYRDGDNSGGELGVRFILRDGGGQVIEVSAYRQLAERERRSALARLIGRQDSLTKYEFLDQLSLARPNPADLPISDRESEAMRTINRSIDRANENYLADNPGFATADLQSALRAAKGYEPTLAEMLPTIRLRPEKMQNPEYWRIGRERDTVLAGLPAFASDDTLVLPEQTLLYHEVFWVVNGCAFKATFQGRKENLALFDRIVDSVTFPKSDDGPVH